MNEKQKKFADYYIETGNAAQSAIRAGYSKKYAKTNTSKLLTNTSKLLTNTNIAQYIKKRLSTLEQERLMTVQRALELSASIAEGEPQLFIYEELDPETDEVIVKEKKRYSARVEERQRSIEHILKVNGAFDRKETITTQDDELRRIADSLGELK